MKKSFVMYTDNIQFIEGLSDEDAGKLLKACLLYHQDKEVVLTPLPNMAFLMLKTQFDRDKKKYEEVIDKKREAGRLGGQAKASKCQQMLAPANSAKQNLANVADNDNVTVNVTDSVIDLDIPTENTEDNKIQNTKISEEWEEYIREEGFASYTARVLIEKGWNPDMTTKKFTEWIATFMQARSITYSETDYQKWKGAFQSMFSYWDEQDKGSRKKKIWLARMTNQKGFNFNLPFTKK